MTANTNKNLGGHPTAERAAEIKTNVVTATMRAFAEKGSAFSMDEVALLAGVSKQAIYRRWRSKIDLVVEAIESVLTAGMEHPLEPQDDPVAALEGLAWRQFGDDQTTSNRLSVYLQVESFRNDRLRNQLVDWHSRIVQMYTRALLAIEVTGQRAAGDIEVQAELLTDMLRGGSQKLAMTGLISETDQRHCFDQRWAAFKLIAIRNVSQAI